MRRSRERSGEIQEKREEIRYPGLDPAVLRSARIAGIPEKHIAEMAKVVSQQQRSSRLGDFPVPKTVTQRGGTPFPSPRRQTPRGRRGRGGRRLNPGWLSSCRLAQAHRDCLPLVEAKGQERQSRSHLRRVWVGARRRRQQQWWRKESSGLERCEAGSFREARFSEQGHRNPDGGQLRHAISSSGCPSDPGVLPRLAGDKVAGAELPVHHPLLVDHRRDRRQPEGRPSGGGLYSRLASIDGGRPAVDRQGELVFGGGNADGGEPPVFQLPTPYPSQRQRAAFYKAGRSEMGQPVGTSPQGHRCLFGAAEEAGKPRRRGCRPPEERGQAKVPCKWKSRAKPPREGGVNPNLKPQPAKVGTEGHQRRPKSGEERGGAKFGKYLAPERSLWRQPAFGPHSPGCCNVRIRITSPNFVGA